MDAAAAWDARARREGWRVLNYPSGGQEDPGGPVGKLELAFMNHDESSLCFSLCTSQSTPSCLAANSQEAETWLGPQSWLEHSDDGG